MSRIMRGARARAFGFTLLELMITVAVAAVLGAVALPYLGSFIDRSHARATASELESAFYYARAEAIARSSDVSVCAKRAAGDNICSDPTDGTAWQNGWLVRDVAADSILRSTSSPPPPEIKVSAGGRGSFVFTRTGLTGSDAGVATNGVVKIERDRGTPVLEGCVVLNSQGGRIRRLAPGTSPCP